MKIAQRNFTYSFIDFLELDRLLKFDFRPGRNENELIASVQLGEIHKFLVSISFRFSFTIERIHRRGGERASSHYRLISSSSPFCLLSARYRRTFIAARLLFI